MKRTHIETDFINFIIEKYSKPQSNDDEDDNTPKKDCDEDDDEQTSKKTTEEDDDKVIEKLLSEYKKVKRIYESRGIQDKRK